MTCCNELLSTALKNVKNHRMRDGGVLLLKLFLISTFYQISYMATYTRYSSIHPMVDKRKLKHKMRNMVDSGTFIWSVH